MDFLPPAGFGYHSANAVRTDHHLCPKQPLIRANFDKVAAIFYLPDSATIK